MAQTIGAVGLDYETAPLRVRSLFTFTATQKIDFSDVLAGAGCRESVILSTCNRTEVYFVSETCGAEKVTELLGGFFGETGYGAYFYSFAGDEAVGHLLRVAAGLQSAVVGEDQILGQVRDACEFAETAGSAGKVLTRLFRTAVTTAKQIKNETGISNIPVSASYIGIRKLSGLMGGLAGKSFLVVGTGEMSLLAVKYLVYEKAGRIRLCSRSCGAGHPRPEGAELVPFAERYAYLPETDAVITATGSPHTVFEGPLERTAERPLYFVDMAVPPDVGESLSGVPNVTILNIDQLQSTAQENLEKRRALSGQAEKTVEASLREMSDWLRRSRVDPAVESLNRRCGEIAADTEAYLFQKLDLDPREKKLVSKMLEASLRRLVREPVLYLKTLDDEGEQDKYIEAVRELFDLR